MHDPDPRPTRTPAAPHTRSDPALERAMADLRITAALVHALPGMRARVRVGDLVVLEVGALGAALTSPATLSPCELRNAVVTASDQGALAPPLDVVARADAAIDLCPPSAGAVHPGGLIRVPISDRWLWAIATTLDAELAYALGASVVAEVDGIAGLAALGLRPDRGLGVCLAYAETRAGPGTSDEGDLVELLQALVGRWTTEELVASVVEGARGPASEGPGAGVAGEA